jgi:predicted kinase
MTKQMILFRGLPGAGKTELAEFLLNLISDHYRTVALSADDYFTDCFGSYNFEYEALKEAHEWCQEQVRQHCFMETEVIGIHNTFTTESEMQPYFELAEEYGYRLSTVIVENRHGSESIHSVPQEKIELFRNRFEVQL